LNKNLDNKVAIITGGSKGIGREIARLFGHFGYRVVISGRDKAAMEQTAARFKEENIDVLPVAGDVTVLEDCKNLITQTIDKYGRLDVLINNAGKSMHGLFADTDLSLFKTIMDINYCGSVTMTKLALPHLIKSSGSVVFISSVAGLKGLPFAAPYSASKAALKSFHESLRAELGSKVHSGILYAGYTQNDPDKVKYNASGELVPSTREKFAATQVDVAKAALRLVRGRKRQVVMTLTGKLAYFAYTVLPGLSEKFLIWYARKTGMHAGDDTCK